jgi:acylphosphatase
MDKIKSVQITISGRVQNVGFRFHTQDEALKLGITGFVMNRPDGAVYIEAEGINEKLDQFILWCHKGPNWARVHKVKIIEQPAINYHTFEIKR